MISDDKKKRIESLSPEEMLYEINLGRKSRFQRESFAYLQTCYQQKIEKEKLENIASQNQSVNEAANINQQIDSLERHISVKNFAFLVAVAVFAVFAIWVFNHYFHLGL